VKYLRRPAAALDSLGELDCDLLDSNRKKPTFARFSVAFGKCPRKFPAGFVRIRILASPRCLLLLGCLADERVGHRSEVNDLLRENAEDFE
jgi:hypothetical protein